LKTSKTCTVGTQGCIAINTCLKVAKVSGRDFLSRERFHFENVYHFGRVCETRTKRFLDFLRKG
jgi:hypothetical protein